MDQAAVREIWRAVLGELQLQLPRPTFETWLKQTEAVSCDGHSLVVEVRTPFAVAWLERRMYQSIQKTVEKITQQSLDIRFQVKNGINQQPGPAFSLDTGHQSSPGASPGASSGHLLGMS